MTFLFLKNIAERIAQIGHNIHFVSQNKSSNTTRLSPSETIVVTRSKTCGLSEMTCATSELLVSSSLTKYSGNVLIACPSTERFKKLISKFTRDFAMTCARKKHTNAQTKTQTNLKVLFLSPRTAPIKVGKTTIKIAKMPKIKPMIDGDITTLQNLYIIILYYMTKNNKQIMALKNALI